VVAGYLLYEIFTKFSSSFHSFDWGQRVGIHIGISLAIIPVSFVWFQAFKLQVNNRNVHIFYSFLLITLSLVVVTKLIKFFALIDINYQMLIFPFYWLILIFFIYLDYSLIMVRDLAAPAWVDSVHHAVITRLIVEKGGLPFSYSPYIDTLSLVTTPVSTQHWQFFIY